MAFSAVSALAASNRLGQRWSVSPAERRDQHAYADDQRYGRSREIKAIGEAGPTCQAGYGGEQQCPSRGQQPECNHDPFPEAFEDRKAEPDPEN
jgi:hypothetical protein